MPATIIAELPTSYQRVILTALLEPLGRWITGYNDSLITRAKNVGDSTDGYGIVFYGTGLWTTETGFTGSVDKIQIYPDFGLFPRPLVAEITGLNIADFNAFVANALTLTNGVPDLTDSDVVDFFAAITPPVMNGTPQADFLVGDQGASTINAGDGNDTISGMNGNDNLFGGNGKDTMFGGAGKDKIYGEKGNDTLKGGGGADLLKGGQGRDKLIGGTGNDTLSGGAGRDKLYGGTQKDTLIGGAGNDLLKGQSGNDVLNGGRGNDLMIGGAGKDSFVFDMVPTGADRITDFVAGQETIRLIGQQAGDVAFSQVGGTTDQFEVVHKNGTILVTVTDQTQPLTMDDFLFF